MSMGIARHCRAMTVVDRALFIAAFGWFLVIAILALAETPTAGESATAASDKPAVVSPTAPAAAESNAPAARPATPDITLQLRRSAVEARHAYLAARSAQAEVQALERQIRPLIDEVNEILAQRSALLRDNPGLPNQAATPNARNAATPAANSSSTHSNTPPAPAAPAAAAQTLAKMEEVIANRKESIRNLVDRQNAIADRDLALIALKSAMQRACDACASNEIARTRSPSTTQRATPQPARP